MRQPVLAYRFFGRRPFHQRSGLSGPQGEEPLGGALERFELAASGELLLRCPVREAGLVVAIPRLPLG